ncbi:hypothetical protein CVT24_000843 [Panaeolus cyanescens]|uniref:Uncharacterized protein n=1 Tax=Panaeolus cyanescens TaxID=181874 RepID=A0A409VVM0_9AGAR|nr:hypothetical protein CVT24_000843 [Panaeolus cyanescens]
MPRRSPPSSLRLAQGPTPSRDTPKHRLPSLPMPAFQVRAADENIIRANAGQPRRRAEDEVKLAVVNKEPGRLRGPWDHSGSISIRVDVDSLLPPLNRAMVVLRG